MCLSAQSTLQRWRGAGDRYRTVSDEHPPLILFPMTSSLRRSGIGVTGSGGGGGGGLSVFIQQTWTLWRCLRRRARSATVTPDSKHVTRGSWNTCDTGTAVWRSQCLGPCDSVSDTVRVFFTACPHWCRPDLRTRSSMICSAPGDGRGYQSVVTS